MANHCLGVLRSFFFLLWAVHILGLVAWEENYGAFFWGFLACWVFYDEEEDLLFQLNRSGWVIEDVDG